MLKNVPQIKAKANRAMHNLVPASNAFLYMHERVLHGTTLPNEYYSKK